MKLLKPGGVLVYSTCTITLSENEEQVAWALKAFPCLQLQPQVIVFSGHFTQSSELVLHTVFAINTFLTTTILTAVDRNNTRISEALLIYFCFYSSVISLCTVDVLIYTTVT